MNLDEESVPSTNVSTDDMAQGQALPLPTVGKVVADHLYLHTTALIHLSPRWIELIEKATALTHTVQDQHFNVVKLRLDGAELSLLNYAHFFESAFPELKNSWRVRFTTETAVFRTYEDSLNPPILHRKELLLPTGDARIPGFQALTSTAEALGLFDDMSRIGLREYWYMLIANRGYELSGVEFIPIANAASTEAQSNQDAGIRRHLTALSRSNFSAPVQSLWRHGFINPARTFFDFGCGKGDDVRSLLVNGIDATGWDPYFFPDAKKSSADSVNIGFVINVIEDLGERAEALRSAFSYSKGVLSVGAMLSSQAPLEGCPHQDGYLTSRNTFQKYYSQLQLRDFIEHTLDEPAIAVGPGVFFVFRDKQLEQRFLALRYGRQVKNTLLRGWVSSARQRNIQSTCGRGTAPKVSRETALFATHAAIFHSLWGTQLELGRPPDFTELDSAVAEAIKTDIGSLQKALRIAGKHFDAADLVRSSEQKRADLLVFAALQQFEERRPYRHLEISLQRDISHFFGDYSRMRMAARNELFDVANLEKLNAACKAAAQNGLGWLEDSHSLQFHTSLLERLPALLRIYVGCATTLAGDTAEFDLIKVHIRSGKVTLMKFDNFEKSPLPRLRQRVKVKLKELDLDVFEYDEDYPEQLLFHKSRYINEEYPHYTEQVELEEMLERLKLVPTEGYGSSAKEFRTDLLRTRWDVEGFALVRSKTIPDLDSPCGAYFTYRQLIECGETQRRTGIANIPQQPDTYTALYNLSVNVIDKVIEYFGMIELTYGFCSATLANSIPSSIAPQVDQHAAHEENRLGRPICSRLGAACDFLVLDEDMEEVAKWVAANTAVDRIYFYGTDRPIHVSYSNTPNRQFVRFVQSASGKRIPKVDRNPDLFES